MLLGTLDASLLGNLLTGKGVTANIPEQGVTQAGEGAPATSSGCEANIPGQFEIQIYYQNEPRFKDV